MALSLRFQTSAIIIASFLASHIAGLVLYNVDRRVSLEMTEAIDRSERAADITRLLHDVSGDRRDRTIEFSDTRNLRVWISSGSAVQVSEPTKSEMDVMAYLRTQLPELPAEDIRVRFISEDDDEVVPPPFNPASRAGSPRATINLPAAANSVAISIRHRGDEWVNFLGSISRSRALPQDLLFSDIVSAAIGIALIAFVMVTRVTAPLGQLAEAADRLGRNLSSPPLSVSGPREVAVAAAAFNRMQRRLLKLIEGRTEFLAAISHDLRTPIAQIKLRLQMMPASPEREKNLHALDDVDEIIGTFLSYARLSQSAEETSRIDLGALVGSICDDLSDTGADIRCDCAPGIVLSCKRLAVKRAVTNLIENALKYGREVRVGMRVLDHEVVVSVVDRGPGISEEQLESVLAPFYRVEKSRTPSSSGFGLGLSIAHAVAEDHGGELRLSNREGGGLRAELVLPLNQS